MTMNKSSLLALLIFFITSFVGSAQDYRDRGMRAVASGNYQDAKDQFEAARTILETKKISRNAQEYIDIERLITRANQCMANKSLANGQLEKLTDDSIREKFSSCASDEEAENAKNSLLASLEKARGSLKSITSTFPSDKVSKTQLERCDEIELKITAYRNSIGEIIAWNKADQKNTIQAYEAFLNDFPKGNYSALAQKKITEEKDKYAWRETERVNTLAAYKNYLKQFPEALHREEAEQQVKTIGIKEDWEIAQKQNTIQGYQDYIKAYPDSEYLKQAEQQIAWIGENNVWEATVTQNTDAAYRNYLSKYPKGRYVSDARNRIDRLSEAAVWKKTTSENTIEAYEHYLKNSKLKAFKDDAEKRIASIKHEQEVEMDNRVWAKVSASTNPADYTEYLRDNGNYKGHLKEAKGYEILYTVRGQSLSISNAKDIFNAYTKAAEYVKLDNEDQQQQLLAAEMVSYEKFTFFRSIADADSYLKQYPQGRYSTEVSDFIARYKADQMTPNVTMDEYNTALSYARSSQAKDYVQKTYQDNLKESRRIQRRMKTEPFHFLVGFEASVSSPEELQSAEGESSSVADAAVLLSLGGHSNRFNFEAGYYFVSSTVLVRPRLNLLKRNYIGSDPLGKRSIFDYTLSYVYIAPEFFYYMKDTYVSADRFVSSKEIDHVDSEGNIYDIAGDLAYPYATAGSYNYGVRAGVGCGMFDFSIGYMFSERKMLSFGFAFYF